jgi:hypothetical protein
MFPQCTDTNIVLVLVFVVTCACKNTVLCCQFTLSAVMHVRCDGLIISWHISVL